MKEIINKNRREKKKSENYNKNKNKKESVLIDCLLSLTKQQIQLHLLMYKKKTYRRP